MLAERLAQEGHDRLVDRARQLGLHQRLLEQPADLVGALALDRVEQPPDRLLAHHQLRDDALVKEQVVREALEQAVDRRLHALLGVGAREQPGQPLEGDGQVGADARLDGGDEGGRHPVEERLRVAGEALHPRLDELADRALHVLAAGEGVHPERRPLLDLLLTRVGEDVRHRPSAQVFRLAREEVAHGIAEDRRGGELDELVGHDRRQPGDGLLQLRDDGAWEDLPCRAVLTRQRPGHPAVERGVERLAEPRRRQLPCEVLGGQEPLPDRLPDALGQALFVLRHGAVEGEEQEAFGLVGVEQHPDRHGVGDAPRHRADADSDHRLDEDGRGLRGHGCSKERA